MAMLMTDISAGNILEMARSSRLPSSFYDEWPLENLNEVIASSNQKKITKLLFNALQSIINTPLTEVPLAQDQCPVMMSLTNGSYILSSSCFQDTEIRTIQDFFKHATFGAETGLVDYSTEASNHADQTGVRILQATEPSPPTQEGEITPEIRALYTRGGTAFNTLQYTVAAPLLREVFDKLPEKTSPFAINTALSAAKAFTLSGQYAESSRLLEFLLQEVERKFPTNSIEAARVHLAIAEAKGKAGDDQGEILILTKAIPFLVECLGAENEKTLQAKMSLANAYGRLKKGEEQKVILTDVLEIMQGTLSPRHPQILRIQSNLANAHCLLGEFPQQLTLLQEVLLAKEAMYGKEHVELANTLHNIALAYGNNGNNITKLDMLERCLAIKRKHYEKTSLEHVPTLIAKASAHDALGRKDKYIACLEDAKKILEAQTQLRASDQKKLGEIAREIAEFYKSRQKAPAQHGDPTKATDVSPEINSRASNTLPPTQMGNYPNPLNPSKTHSGTEPPAAASPTSSGA